MSGTIVLILILVGMFWLRTKVMRKIGELINSIDELQMDLEVAIRRGDLSSLEEIEKKAQVIKKSYPMFAKIGDFKSGHAEFVNCYNNLMNQIYLAYREEEIQFRMEN